MKTIALSLLVLTVFSYSGALGCSETGVKDLKVPKEVLEKASLAAIEYARAVAEVEYRQNPTDSTFQLPYSNMSANLSEAKKGKKGMSSTFTLSTSFTTQSNWDCLYCVEFRLDNGVHSFSRVIHHHCAQ